MSFKVGFRTHDRRLCSHLECKQRAEKIKGTTWVVVGQVLEVSKIVVDSHVEESAYLSRVFI